ncbi:hypothetical protein CsSME_00023882 [Camellia sinensis var. sinensis]
MRIRKHAKLAGLTYAASAADLSPPALQSHICHLNQSPWDAISFPPDSASSPFQVDGEDSFTVNASLGDSPGAVESVTSMKTSVVDGQNAINNVDKIEDANERKDKLGFGKNGVILCCKSHEKDWKCKKSENVAIRRRPRPKKPARSSSNPYEFYYYSGFGPRWGKKRGTNTNVEFIRVESDTKDVDEVKVIVTKATTTPYSSSSSQIDNEEFDYIEDDDDDDDENVEECGEFGKKRGRKPIKARSLKSLM